MWVKKVFAPAALLVGFGVAAIGLAQQPGDDEGQPPEQKKGFDKKGFDRKGPFGGFDKKADPKADPQPEPRRGGAQPTPGGRGERSDPAVDAWVRVLIEKITDPHDTIRDSARGALVGVGRPALPALERLADGNDGAKAVAAKKVIAMIERTSGRGPMAGPPMERGRGGEGERGRGEGDRGRGGDWDRGPGRPGFPGASGPPGFGPGGPGFPGGPMGPGFGPGGGGRGPSGPMGPGATPPGGRPGAGPMGPGGTPMGPGGTTPGARPGTGRPGEPPMPPGRPGGRGPGEGQDEIPPIRPE